MTVVDLYDQTVLFQRQKNVVLSPRCLITYLAIVSTVGYKVEMFHHSVKVFVMVDDRLELYRLAVHIQSKLSYSPCDSQ